MGHDAGLFLGQVGQAAVPCHGLCHAGNGAQRVAVAGVQLLGQKHQRLALGKNGVAAGGVGVVHNAHVGHGQAGGRRKLGGGHPHLLHMRRQAALCQLAQGRVLAGLRVGRGGDDGSHVGLEFVGNDGVILLIGHAEDVLLGRGGKFQCDGGVGCRADVIVDQSADGLFEPGTAEGLGVGGVPNQRFHQWTAHLVGVALRRPEAAIGMQHNDRVICVEVDHGRPPCALEVLILHGVHDGKAAVDAALLAAPEGGCRGRRVEPDAAADGVVPGQGGKGAAVFQLVPAGLGVLCHKAVVGHQLCKAVQTAAGAHEAVEHAPRCQHVHGLLAPAAAHFQVAQALRQGNAKVHVLQGDVALVIFIFQAVAALVVVVGVGQILQLLQFFRAQALHRAKIQGDEHGAPFSRCASCG